MPLDPSSLRTSSVPDLAPGMKPGGEAIKHSDLGPPPQPQNSVRPDTSPILDRMPMDLAALISSSAEVNPGGMTVQDSPFGPAIAHTISRSVSIASQEPSALPVMHGCTDLHSSAATKLVADPGGVYGQGSTLRPSSDHGLLQPDSNTGQIFHAVPDQQIEDQVINSHSSSDVSSDSPGGLNDSDSDDLLGEELAAMSPPNTRSRRKASKQSLPKLSDHGKAPGSSSSKKSKRKKARRPQR